MLTEAAAERNWMFWFDELDGEELMKKNQDLEDVTE